MSATTFKRAVAAVGMAAAMVAANQAAPAPEQGGRVCMDRVAWSADDAERPCWALEVFEDGSARAVLHRAGGLRRAIRVCSLPAVDGGRPACKRKRGGR